MTKIMAYKVGKIPVVYIAGAIIAVVILVYAIRMRPAVAAENSDKNKTADPPTGSDEILPAPTNGTVIVAPQPLPTESARKQFESNDDWLSASVGFLGKTGVNNLSAQRALSTYLDGGNLTYDESLWVNKAITEYGLPPYPPATVNPVPPKPGSPAPTPASPPASLTKPPLKTIPENGVWDAATQNAVARTMRLPQPITSTADFWRKVGARGNIGLNNRTGAANPETVKVLERWAGKLTLDGKLDSATIKRVQNVANDQIRVGHYL